MVRRAMHYGFMDLLVLGFIYKFSKCVYECVCGGWYVLVYSVFIFVIFMFSRKMLKIEWHPY